MALYYNVNDDMDKKAAKLFKQLSDDNKDYLEKAYEDAKKSGKPLSTEEINSFLEIKEARRQIAHADEQWEKGKWAQQNVNPDIAKEYYDSYVDKHQKIIDRNKALHRESAFIKDKRVDLSGSGKNILDTSGILRTTNASMFPSWEDIKNLGTRAGEGIIKGLQYLDPFSSAYGSENKDSFIFPEKKYRTSNVYDDIGQHSERRIQEKPFSENYNYDKANFLGIDSEAQDIANREFAADPTFQTSEEEEEYNEYLRSIEQMPTIKDPNIFQRFRNNFYKPAAGAVNYGGETYSPAQLNQMNALGGYYSEPARAQRRWEKRQTNVLNRAAAGKPVGNVDLLLGEQGYTSDGDGGISFTGTPQGDPTAGAGYSRSDDSWSASTFKQGGRVRYAEGGIVNLLPKGAW